MRKEKEDDLKWLQEEHARRLDEKYRAGDKKHGDDLLEKTPKEFLEDAIEENLDQFVYIMRALRDL